MKLPTTVIDFRRASKQGLLDASFSESASELPTALKRNVALTEAPVDVLHGVGPKTSKALKDMGIHTAMDLARSKFAPPLEACFNPRQAAALVSLKVGLAGCLKPIEASPEPPPFVPSVFRAPSAGPTAWEQKQLDSAPRSASGKIIEHISHGMHRNGWEEIQRVLMTDAEFLAHRRDQEDHQAHLTMLKMPWL